MTETTPIGAHPSSAPDAHSLAVRLAAVRGRIDTLCAALGRDPAQIRLLPVSKTHDAASVRAVYNLGVREFGENYPQELLSKAAALNDLPSSWIFIGTLQSNKIRSLVKVASEIHGVSKLRHLTLISEEARAVGKAPYPVYLSVNAGGESTKSGISPAEVAGVVRAIRDDPGIRLCGLMAIPPPAYSDAAWGASVPPLYRDLRRLADGAGEGKLSLGMTADMGIAIAAGSDCLRIGTAIFGPRAVRVTAADS